MRITHPYLSSIYPSNRGLNIDTDYSPIRWMSPSLVCWSFAISGCWSQPPTICHPSIWSDPRLNLDPRLSRDQIVSPNIVCQSFAISGCNNYRLVSCIIGLVDLVASKIASWLSCLEFRFRAWLPGMTWYTYSLTGQLGLQITGGLETIFCLPAGRPDFLACSATATLIIPNFKLKKTVLALEDIYIHMGVK
jgi:hypothetical protein